MEKKTVSGILFTLLLTSMLTLAFSIQSAKAEGHDAAVVDVKSSKTIVGQGYSASINVTVENQGDFYETLRVSVCYNELVIPTSEQMDTFRSKGDANRDGHIDQTDLQEIIGNIGWSGPNGENPCDINNDGTVNTIDIVICASNQGLDIWTYLGLGTPPIGTQIVGSLQTGSSKTITFTWKTTDFAKGNYTINACIWPVEDEADTEDNTLTNGWVIVTIPGDVEFDKTVIVLDLILIANHLGHFNGEEHIPYSKEWYDCMNTDINSDNQHNVLDLIICANHLGETWS
jgi:hypothetical protein